MMPSTVSRTARVCSVEGCEGKHHAKGYCGSCYQKLVNLENRRAWQKRKYAEDPAFRAMRLANSKRHAVKKDATERIAAWKRANRDKVRANNAAARARHRERTGCDHSAKYQPGAEVMVVVNGRPYASILKSPAYRFEGKWAVDVLLPWGERVRFWTKEVAL